jgi:hypothetical protein
MARPFWLLGLGTVDEVEMNVPVLGVHSDQAGRLLLLKKVRCILAVEGDSWSRMSAHRPRLNRQNRPGEKV